MKSVTIHLLSNSMGDTIAIVPYVLEYKRKHNVDVFFKINKSFINILEPSYSEINFIGKDINNFDDLASVIQNMDLVISTDTSIPHLAGALGKKVFILLGLITDWRWMLNSKISPWYNSATLYRKKINPKNKTADWTQAFEEILRELKI